MSLISFNQLPDTARLWAFNAERGLTDAETERLREALEGFLTTWAAHRKDLAAGYELRHNQFILVGVDESMLPPSGCSIDSMVGALMEIGKMMGVELVDAPDVAYRSGDAIRTVDRNTFAELAGRGEVDADTIIFDRTAQRVGDVRGGRWERPARESWHARAFDLKETSGS
jgi:hypothetical protein